MSVSLADFSAQGENVNSFISSFSTGNVPHAAIIDGPTGSGKNTLSGLLSQLLFCENRNGGEPCGVCPSCVQIAAGTHPDLIMLSKQKALIKGAKTDRKSIGVDDIRELISLTAVFTTTGKRIVVLEDADTLTVEAQNSLLKTLEEPPENVIFVLATTEPQKIPATILSRCIKFDFKRVPEKVLCEGMQKICTDLGIKVSEAAIRLIAANADGSVTLVANYVLRGMGVILR